MNELDKMKNAISGRLDLVAAFHNAVDKMKDDKVEWIKRLRSKGYKAAHPNDGWVFRDEMKIHLAYPQFNDGLAVGDKMMIGSPHNYERPVIIVGKTDPGFIEYYFFRDLD